jgi:hypothetical protein
MVAAPAKPVRKPHRRRFAPLDGAWLRGERERLGLTRNTLRQLLDTSWTTVAVVEDRQRPVLRKWRPQLRELGFDLSLASRAPKPASATPPQPPVTQAPSVATATAVVEDRFALIVRYRLAFGQRSGQSAVETLAALAHDLLLADLGRAISQADLSALFDSLLARRAR